MGRKTVEDDPQTTLFRTAAEITDKLSKNLQEANSNSQTDLVLNTKQKTQIAKLLREKGATAEDLRGYLEALNPNSHPQIMNALMEELTKCMDFIEAISEKILAQSDTNIKHGLLSSMVQAFNRLAFPKDPLLGVEEKEKKEIPLEKNDFVVVTPNGNGHKLKTFKGLGSLVVLTEPVKENGNEKPDRNQEIREKHLSKKKPNDNTVLSELSENGKVELYKREIQDIFDKTNIDSCYLDETLGFAQLLNNLRVNANNNYNLNFASSDFRSAYVQFLLDSLTSSKNLNTEYRRTPLYLNTLKIFVFTNINSQMRVQEDFYNKRLLNMNFMVQASLKLLSDINTEAPELVLNLRTNCNDYRSAELSIESRTKYAKEVLIKVLPVPNSSENAYNVMDLAAFKDLSAKTEYPYFLANWYGFLATKALPKDSGPLNLPLFVVFVPTYNVLKDTELNYWKVGREFENVKTLLRSFVS